MKIILMMAITLDGIIGKHKSHFADWTSREDKQLFMDISKEVGVVLMGKNTFDTFSKPLPDRLNVVFTEEDKAGMEGVMWVKGDIKEVIKRLEEKYDTAILGGGSYLNSLFLKEKLINEMMITIEPKLFGSGLTLFTDEYDIDLELIDIKKLNNNTINLHYKVKYDTI